MVAAASVSGLFGGIADAQTLRVAMNSDVKILDPIWTTAYIQRDFGYMVWDTLFSLDEKFEVKPQMVEKYDVLPTSSPGPSRCATTSGATASR
jgi:peptide/nickel transport system substrate-binding protein